MLEEIRNRMKGEVEWRMRRTRKRKMGIRGMRKGH